MTPLIRAQAALGRAAATLHARLQDWTRHPDRGEVPGWVLITIMIAGLVAALWLVAEPLLGGLVYQRRVGRTSVVRGMLRACQ